MSERVDIPKKEGVILGLTLKTGTIDILPKKIVVQPRFIKCAKCIENKPSPAQPFGRFLGLSSGNSIRSSYVCSPTGRACEYELQDIDSPLGGDYQPPPNQLALIENNSPSCSSSVVKEYSAGMALPVEYKPAGQYECVEVDSHPVAVFQPDRWVVRKPHRVITRVNLEDLHSDEHKEVSAELQSIACTVGVCAVEQCPMCERMAGRFSSCGLLRYIKFDDERDNSRAKLALGAAIHPKVYNIKDTAGAIAQPTDSQ